MQQIAEDQAEKTPNKSSWLDEGYFVSDIESADKDVADAIDAELVRQNNGIELIASENIVSKAVMQAQGSVFTNKYAEGYPGKRYYCGCQNADKVETLAIERAKKLFNCQYANVQPHSGSQANHAVMLAFVKPGEKIMGLSLDSGGHLTHGARPNHSGKWFDVIRYGVRRQDYRIDYDEVEQLALENRPKLIIAGASAYPRFIDFARFRDIADKSGALLMVDMAHIAGLVAAGVHPTPLPYADVVTTTTHKTMRGARGGMILTNKKDIAAKVNSAVFPGMQGGALLHVIAAKAIGFKEALKPSFRQYGRQVVDNAQAIAARLQKRNVQVFTGGTDNHIILVDLRSRKLTGLAVSDALEKCSITCNKNAVPFDTEPPTICSGIRLGSAAITTRGFDLQASITTADLIADVIDKLQENGDLTKVDCKKIINQVKILCKRFPLYPAL